MKVAIIGTRSLNLNIEKYLPKNISLIISGGAKGIDKLAEKYADKNGIQKLIFLPDYEKYRGKIAPLERNKLIVENADLIIAFWNGVSKGTKFTINYAKKIGKKVKIIYADSMHTLMPGNYGNDCIASGGQYNSYGDLVACLCYDCDYSKCCDSIHYPQICKNCLDEYCQRKLF